LKTLAKSGQNPPLTSSFPLHKIRPEGALEQVFVNGDCAELLQFVGGVSKIFPNLSEMIRNVNPKMGDMIYVLDRLNLNRPF